MKIKNTHSHYGLLTISLHWLMAIVIFSLLAIGFYMVDLDYYDSGYQVWPFWHKSIGVTLFFLLILRLIWHRVSKKPTSLPTHQKWETGLSHAIHTLLYLALFIICISGYLISTAEGDPISVFNWFKLPAIIEIDKKADLAGKIHFYVALLLIAAVILHVLGALKHALIDKDNTLLRIFGK